MHQAEKSSPQALLPLLETPQSAGRKSQRPNRYHLLTAAAISCCLLLFFNTSPACLRQIGRGLTQHDHTTSHESTVSDFRSCSIKNFQATHFPFLEGVRPIAHDEFVARRQRLAQALLSDGADAFVVEPGKLACNCREYSMGNVADMYPLSRQAILSPTMRISLSNNGRYGNPKSVLSSW
jgi:hypothetical protein